MMMFAASKKGGRPKKSRLNKSKKAIKNAEPLHDDVGEGDELAELFGASKSDFGGLGTMEIMGKLGGNRIGDTAKAALMSELAMAYDNAKKNRGIESTEQWLMVALALKDFSAAAGICLNLNKFHDAEQNLLKSKMPAKDASSKIGDFCASKGFSSYAAEYYKKAGRFMEAGLLFSKLERHRAAALCYEKAGDAGLAAKANRLADQAPYQRQ
jgi:hypothetical protein